jgi:hypothetical protein
MRASSAAAIAPNCTVLEEPVDVPEAGGAAMEFARVVAGPVAAPETPELAPASSVPARRPGAVLADDAVAAAAAADVVAPA